MEEKIKRLEEALFAIEGLTYFMDMEDHNVGTIYTIAHNVTGHCKSCNHYDEIITQVKEKLKNANIIDIDKYMKVKSD